MMTTKVVIIRELISCFSGAMAVDLKVRAILPLLYSLETEGTLNFFMCPLTVVYSMCT